MSEQEAAKLSSWVASGKENKALFEKVMREDWIAGSLAELDEYDTRRRIEQVISLLDDQQEQNTVPQPQQKPEADYFPEEVPAINREQPFGVFSFRDFVRNRWFRYAAAVLLLIGAGFYFRDRIFPGSNESAGAAQHVDAEPKDVLPGGQRAMLTLADGSVIVLDDAVNGELAVQGDARVVKEGDRIIYNANQPAAGRELVYNTMTTPRGGQYQLSLPDGSKVWLNAASSISYPTIFPEDKREVMITGEAYFEVTKDSKRPFRVNVNKKHSIEVLGTEFNVNAYEDELSTYTTLLKGSLDVVSEGNRLHLQPREQARVDQSGNMKMVRNPNVEQATAWKYGVFNFQYDKLESVMRQIARWYDVTVEYEKGIPDIELYGKMGRDLKLSQILQVLTDMEVKYRLENGRTLVILPK